jgi:hypothetical protein
MKAKTIFITLKIDTIDQLLDYPQNIPLPRVGEYIIYNDNYCKVEKITHNIVGTVVNVRIDAWKVH